MIDLIFLSACPFLGYCVYLGALSHKLPDETRFNHLFHGLKAISSPDPVKGWQFVETGVVDSESAVLWADLMKESERERLAMAKRALENIVDVSCDQVAEAFSLPKLSVRRVSVRGRRKGKALGVYSKEEIINAGKAPVEALAHSNEVPF